MSDIFVLGVLAAIVYFTHIVVYIKLSDKVNTLYRLIHEVTLVDLTISEKILVLQAGQEELEAKLNNRKTLEEDHH